ncbi:unannotated protein [freshwater metagenome]|uniref:Unannotated protein n=1 Tax=freshwater metagenome TaxID=449393 RepID=A0A6J7ST55_9ZZZZ
MIAFIPSPYLDLPEVSVEIISAFEFGASPYGANFQAINEAIASTIAAGRLGRLVS